MEQTDVERTECSRVCKTLFSDTETIKMARQLANCLREKARLESDLASVKKSFAGDIGKQEAEISALQEKLNTGWEMRRQDCIQEKNFQTGNVMVYRTDTAEIIEERAMTFEERQMKMKLEGPADDGEQSPQSMFVEPGVEGAEATPDPPEIPSQDAGNAPKTIFTADPIPVVASEVPENELPEDNHPFYNGKKNGKKKRNLKLVEEIGEKE